ncbi:MAG: hypothetical protein AAGC86_13105 [Pseudomonadota bacterium]
MLLGSNFLTRAALWSVLSLAVVAAASAPVRAQSSLEAQRDALFDRMFEAPTDLDLMLGYARLSVQLRDYEQVVATLERVVAQRPDLIEARLELAIAYYALGAYEIAVYHFNIVRGAPNAPPELIAEIDSYTANAETRTSRNSVTGFIEAGPAYGFVDGGAGVEVGFGLTWRYQFEGANDLSWLTELRATALHFPDDDDETFTYFLLRTGPEFSLDGTAYGARLRPYLALRSSVDFDLDNRSTAGFGLQYSDTFGTDWAGFALLEGGALRRTDYDEDITGSFISAQIGATYFPTRNSLVRLALRARKDETDNDLTDILSWGGRLDVQYSFRPSWARSDRLWKVGAYTVLDWQRFTALTPEREDLIYGFGASLRAYVKDDYYVEARADILRRDTDVPGAATSREAVSIVFGRDF